MDDTYLVVVKDYLINLDLKFLIVDMKQLGKLILKLCNHKAQKGIRYRILSIQRLGELSDVNDFMKDLLPDDLETGQ